MHIIIKIMSIWNIISDFYQAYQKKCKQFFYYIEDYFYGHHDTWVFIPGQTIPITLSNLYNKVHVSWIYDNNTNNLKYYTNDKIPNYNHYKLDWLSAKIKITDSINFDKTSEFSIDDFLNDFSISTYTTKPPTLNHVFMSWCSHTKHWFKEADKIEFFIIDDMGSEVVINMTDKQYILSIIDNKLRINKADTISTASE